VKCGTHGDPHALASVFKERELARSAPDRHVKDLSSLRNINIYNIN
jgi:hypothetical protein